MQRYIIDTHIYIWYAKERENLSRDVLAILDDYENQIYLSAESLREFVLLWNGMPLISDDDKFPFYRGQGLELIENR